MYKIPRSFCIQYMHIYIGVHGCMLSVCLCFNLSTSGVRQFVFFSLDLGICMALPFQATNKGSFCREYGLQQTALLHAKKVRSQLEALLLSPQVGVKRIASAMQKKERENDRDDHHHHHQQATLEETGLVKVRQCLASGCWLRTARLQRDGKSYLTTVSTRVGDDSRLRECTTE